MPDIFPAMIVLVISFFFLRDFLVVSRPDIIDTGYAKYLGNRTNSRVVAYLGIPYAEPPLGDRRFRAPLPLNTTRISSSANGQVIPADVYPQFCIQGSVNGDDAGGAGSEDCLKVNIYAPVGANKGSKFPVLVYIHGGGYVQGNPAAWPFDHWVQQSPNIVIVSIYYRLSSFGFLATPEFSRDPTYGDLNAGFKDQIMALKWIKQYISAFGGDPDQVTINGESAGGSSVELHLVAKESEKLFSGAIAQSLYRSPLPTPEQQQPLFEFYADHAGCGSGTVISQLNCLRSVSVSALARAQDAANLASNLTYKIFRPVVDGQLLVGNPTESIIAGQFADVPFIVGATTNDGFDWGTKVRDKMKEFYPLMTDSDVDDIISVYLPEDFESEAIRLHAEGGESVNSCAGPIIGPVFAARNPTWMYRYNQRNPTVDSTQVLHTAENWMMFRGTNTGLNGSYTFTAMTPDEIAFSKELIAYWVSFVRSGSPNTFKLPKSPVWPSIVPSNKANIPRLVFQMDNTSVATDTPTGIHVESVPTAEMRRCGVVRSKASKQQN